MTALAERPLLPLGRLATSGAPLVAIGGGVHLAVAAAHRPDVVAMAAFVGAGLAQIGVAIALGLRTTRRLQGVGIAVSALLLATWAASRLFGVTVGHAHGAGEGVGILDAVTVAVEVAAVVALARDLRSKPGPFGWAAWTATGVVFAAATGWGVLVAVGGTGDHGHIPRPVVPVSTAADEPRTAPRETPASHGAPVEDPHSLAEPHAHP